MAKVSKRLTVTYTDGRSHTVKVAPRAQVMAERHFGKSLLDLGKVEEAYYLGWCCMTAAGLEHGDFESFLDRLEDVDAAADDAPVVPTGQALSPATSFD